MEAEYTALYLYLHIFFILSSKRTWSELPKLEGESGTLTVVREYTSLVVLALPQAPQQKKICGFWMSQPQQEEDLIHLQYIWRLDIAHKFLDFLHYFINLIILLATS